MNARNANASAHTAPFSRGFCFPGGRYFSESFYRGYYRRDSLGYSRMRRACP